MEGQPDERPGCTRVGLHNCSGEWRNHDRAEDVPFEFGIRPSVRTMINLAREGRVIE